MKNLNQQRNINQNKFRTDNIPLDSQNESNINNFTQFQVSQNDHQKINRNNIFFPSKHKINSHLKQQHQEPRSKDNLIVKDGNFSGSTEKNTLQQLNSKVIQQKICNESYYRDEFSHLINDICSINSVNHTGELNKFLHDKRLNEMDQKIYNQANKHSSQFYSLNKCHYDKQIKQKYFSQEKQSFDQLQITSFLEKNNLFMYIKEAQIQYPIPDHVFLYIKNNSSQCQPIKNIKPEKLPNGFSYFLQILNLSYLFPELFKFQQETITKFTQILQTPFQRQKQNQSDLESMYVNLLQNSFQTYLNTLTNVIIHDLTSQKLQSITFYQKTYNLLSLTKFCQQNQLLQFVLKYSWPIILLQIIKVSSQDDRKIIENDSSCKNYRFSKSVEYIKNSLINGNYQINCNLELKFQIISILIDSYTKTNSFRQLFNKKIETNRNLNKRKNQLEQEKKNIQQLIKKINATKHKKTKKISKSDKKKKIGQQNHSDQQIDDNSHQKIQNQQVQILLKKIQQINEQIQNENRLQSFSCVHYMGKDMQNNLYWFVTYFPQKLFIQKYDSSWYYLPIQQIYNFCQNLNKKAINQNRLYEKIHLYYRIPLYKYQTKIEIQTNQNKILNGTDQSIQAINHNGMDYHLKIDQLNGVNENHVNDLNENDENDQEVDSSKNSGQNNDFLFGLDQIKIDKDSLFRMIQIAQKKMTQYLKDRNSRWGNQENKQHLFNTLRSNESNWLETIKKEIALFNQKICVVEIQYKVFVQQSTQQVDSKIKKIQTKIWGINEKYKHNWYDFISSCDNFRDLYFAVTILYALVRKYTSKHRKLRKEYEEIKQKTVWKTTDGIKQWKKNWNEICQVCGLVGEVLCCDFCPKVYHLECINLKQIPHDQYKCKSCKEQITTRNQLKSLILDGKKNRKK